MVDSVAAGFAPPNNGPAGASMVGVVTDVDVFPVLPNKLEAGFDAAEFMLPNSPLLAGFDASSFFCAPMGGNPAGVVEGRPPNKGFAGVAVGAALAEPK